MNTEQEIQKRTEKLVKGLAIEFTNLFFRSEFTEQLRWLCEYADYTQYVRIHFCGDGEKTMDHWETYIYPLMRDIARRIDDVCSLHISVTHDGFFFAMDHRAIERGQGVIGTDDVDWEKKEIHIWDDNVRNWVDSQVWSEIIDEEQNQ